jgi:hypothetical protein
MVVVIDSMPTTTSGDARPVIRLAIEIRCGEKQRGSQHGDMSGRDFTDAGTQDDQRP